MSFWSRLKSDVAKVADYVASNPTIVATAYQAGEAMITAPGGVFTTSALKNAVAVVSAARGGDEAAQHQIEGVAAKAAAGDVPAKNAMAAFQVANDGLKGSGVAVGWSLLDGDW